ncbi:MAG: pyridoxine 5'-phosphate synthase [Rhodospirillales bacterium]
MTVLSVNLNKVALLRNQRDLTYPNVPEMARIAISVGADGITVHPRPDERHIRRADVRELAAMLKAEYAGSIEFNIEGYPSDDFIGLVEETRPDQVTLVPDAPEQNTSDHGWNVPAAHDQLLHCIPRIKQTGARVSLFLDDDPSLPAAAASVGADRIELYTGPYHHAFMEGRAAEAIGRFVATARAASDAGLGVNAGHDLNLENLGGFLSAIPWVAEVSIGHAITADALKWGMAETVRRYVHLIEVSTAQPARQAV